MCIEMKEEEMETRERKWKIRRNGRGGREGTEIWENWRKKNIRGGAGGEESVQTACYIVLDTYDITIFRLGLCYKKK